MSAATESKLKAWRERNKPAESPVERHAQLQVERDALKRESRFVDLAIANVRENQRAAARHLDERQQPLAFRDAQQVHPDLVTAWVISSDAWADSQIARIEADAKIEGRWSPYTSTEAAARIVAIDAELAELERVMALDAARERAAAAAAELAALENSEAPKVVAP